MREDSGVIDARETFFCTNCGTKFTHEEVARWASLHGCYECKNYVEADVVYGIPEVYFAIDRRGGVA